MKKHEFFVRERLPVPPIVLELLQQIPVVLKFANVYDAPTSRKTELYSALCTSWTGHAFLEDLVDDVLDPDFLGVEGLQLANETTNEVYGIVVVRKRDERLIIEALGTVQKSGWPLGTILLATTLHLAFHFHNYAIVKLATRFDTRAYYMYKRMGFVVTYEERNVVDMQLGNGNLSEETLRRLIEDRSFSNAQTDVIFFPTGAKTPGKSSRDRRLREGDMIVHNRYRLIKRLGEGAFALAWKAERVSDGEGIVLRFSSGELPERAKSLLDSHGLTPRQLYRHRIIPINLIFDDEEVTEIPFASGVRLDKLIQPKNGDDLSRARDYIQITVQLIMAVGFLHQNNLVHGDVYEHNMVYSEEDGLKLFDLDGVAELTYYGPKPPRYERSGNKVHDIDQVRKVLLDLYAQWPMKDYFGVQSPTSARLASFFASVEGSVSKYTPDLPAALQKILPLAERLVEELDLPPMMPLYLVPPIALIGAQNKIQEVGAINTTEYKDGHTAGERVKPFMNYPEYELLKKLGSGANATVWKAQSDDSVVVLRFSRYSEEQVPTKIIQTFLDRGITGKQMLDHHLIPIWVSIDVPAFKQYVTLMPYWEGENPEKIAEALAYPRNLEDLKAYLAFSGRCFIDLMDAVCYMHKNGLLQMDVNPSNMLYKNNRLVLFDYGIMVSLPASEEDLVLEIAFIEQAIGTLCQFNRGFHIAAKALGEPIFARLYEDANYMVHHELTIEAVENLKATYTPWFIELFTEYGIDPTQKPLPKIAPDYVTSPLAPTGAPIRREKADAASAKPYKRPDINLPPNLRDDWGETHWNVPDITQDVDADIFDEYIDATRVYYNNLDDEHRSILWKYTQNAGGIYLNIVLRTGKSYYSMSVKEAEQFKKTLDEVIDGAPSLPFDLTVYRGIGPTTSFDPSKTFTDKAFVSTSTSYDRAVMFGGKTLLAIHLEKGFRHGFYIGALWDFEAELLLRSDLTFEITSLISRDKGYKSILDYQVRSPTIPTGALFRRRSDALRAGFFSGEEFNIPFTDLEHYAVSNLKVNNGADGLVLKRFTEPLNDISLLTRNWLDHEDVMVARPRSGKTTTYQEQTYLFLDDTPLISTDNARLQKYMRKVLSGDAIYDGIVVYTDYEQRRPVGLLIVRWEGDAMVRVKLLKINSGSIGLGVAKLLFRALLYTAKLKQTAYILVTVDQFAGVTRVFDRLGFRRRTVPTEAGLASYALDMSTVQTHYLFSYEFDTAMYHT